MADDYWDHPSRRETKRLIDLADVGAILDELQQGSTEWDDAREALDNLVRGANYANAGLNEALAATETERDAARAEVEHVRAERDDARSAQERLADDMERLIAEVTDERRRRADHVRQLEGERDEARAALAQITAAAQRAARSNDPAPILYAALQTVERDDTQRRLESDLRELAVLRRDVGAVQAERDGARAEVERLSEEERRQRETAEAAKTGWLKAANEVEQLRKDLAETTHVLAVTGEKVEALRGQRDRAEGERDQAREQVKRVREIHTGVCSGACGLDDACECEDRDLICGEDNDRWPCPTIRALDGTEDGR